MTKCSVIVCDKQPGCWKLILAPQLEPEQQAINQCSLRPLSKSDKKEKAPISIVSFIKNQGGLNPDYNCGQWRHELAMLREQGKGLMPGLLNRRSTRTFEEHAQACQEAGYIMESDVDMMLWALAKDVEATAYNEPWNRVYGYDGHAWAAEQDYQRWAERINEIAA